MANSTTENFTPDEINEHISSPSVKRQFRVDCSPTKHTIHVLQWNILAQAMSQPENNFVRIKSDIVTHDYRKWRTLEQILIRQPDLCALEEVDIFDCFLQDQLAKYGYNCFFTPKPHSACLLFQHDSVNFKGPDGTLLCYKTDVFNEIHRSQHPLPYEGKHPNQLFAVLELEHKSSKTPIVFIGTHLKAKRPFSATRGHQAQAIVKYLAEQYPTRAHVIIAGDFNGESDEPLYAEIYQSGLRSAYRTLMNDQEPSFTTWKFREHDGNQREECRTIDYIFYKPEGFTPSAILQLPSKSDIGSDGLPAANYPSDHLALEAIFNIHGCD